MQNEPLRVDESTDVAAFQQELQRVVPQLKITIRPNLKVNGLKHFLPSQSAYYCCSFICFLTVQFKGLENAWRTN